MFTWLGRFNYRHRRGILGVAGAFIVFAVVWGGGVFGAMGSGGYSPPDAETNRANALLEQRFGHRPGDLDALAVYTDPTGTRTVDDPAFAAAVQNALRRLDPTEVLSAVSYWSPDRTPDQREQMVSRDRHSTYAVLTLHGDNDDERLRAYAAIQDDVRADGLDTHLGGGFTSEHQLQLIAARNLADSQVVALPILLILLVLFFGGVLAGVLPPALGVTAILGAMVLMRALTYLTEISIFALEISILLGLGLAIDYGLFIVARFREELRRPGTVADAVAATVATAGRTVAFSGLTVVIGLCGLFFFPQPVSRSFAWGGVTAVLFNIAAAIIVLPALLAVIGHRIDALRIPLPRRRLGGTGGAWTRFADGVMRRPVLSLVGALAFLLVAAAPLSALQPGLTNHRYLPVTNEGQVVARMLTEKFPERGPAEPQIDLAVAGSADSAALDRYVRDLRRLPGAMGAEVHQEQAGLAWVRVAYRGEADDATNLRLVEEIRRQPPPAGVREVLVGGKGGPALSLDNSRATRDALPWALLFIGGATLLLLFLAFRSVLVPIKAVLAGFLSLAASLGIIVWAL